MKLTINPRLRRIIALKPKDANRPKVRPLYKNLEFFNEGYLVRKIEGTTWNRKETIVYNMRFFGKSGGPQIA